MATSSGKFYIGTDTRITLAGVQNEDGAFLGEGATITATLVDSKGASVAGVNTITFEYQVGTDGNFVGYVPSTAAMKAKDKYSLRIVVAYDSRQMTVMVTRTAEYVLG